MTASASFSSTSLAQAGASSGSGFEGDLAAFEAAAASGGASAAAGGFSSTFESSSFTTGGSVGGLETGYVLGRIGGAGFGSAGFGGTSSSFETSSFSGGFGNVESEFAAADTNHDGTLDQGEFANFLSMYTNKT